MADPLDKLFDPAAVAPRWTRAEPAPAPAPAPAPPSPAPPSPAPTRAHDALAQLSAETLALDVLALPEKVRARKALIILFQQIKDCVDKIEPAGPAPAAPAAPTAPDLAAVRADLAALLDRVEDHLEALVLYQPRQP